MSGRFALRFSEILCGVDSCRRAARCRRHQRREGGARSRAAQERAAHARAGQRAPGPRRRAAAREAVVDGLMGSKIQAAAARVILLSFIQARERLRIT